MNLSYPSYWSFGHLGEKNVSELGESKVKKKKTFASVDSFYCETFELTDHRVKTFDIDDLQGNVCRCSAYDKERFFCSSTFLDFILLDEGKRYFSLSVSTSKTKTVTFSFVQVQESKTISQNTHTKNV